MNRTEDLNVKVWEKATSCVIDNAGPCVKILATTHCRPQEYAGRAGLEAIARHCHAAITRGGDDCRHDAGDWLAAALGAWLPGRRGAQAPQAQAWLEEGGWDPGVPGCNRRQRQARHSPLQAPVVLSPRAAHQDRSCPAGPQITRLRDCAPARSPRQLA